MSVVAKASSSSSVVTRQIKLIDFDPVSQTNSLILTTFMSLHLLSEFGEGRKSSGWDWQSCPQSHGQTITGWKVAVNSVTPLLRSSVDLEIMTLAPALRFIFTISPHYPVFLCSRLV
ncbi:hypothetical protein AMECASPLE_009056 [Ameca splendens]|uniref:Uncharacterized protein n=1 Tax=Ameca splendens TaxID=208324 RepID=A0ABV0XP72_9TELE